MIPLLVVEKTVAASAPLTVEEVYLRHGSAVVRWASRLGGPGVELEDAVQEVFLRVQKDLAGFRGDAQLTTWLYQITRNVVGHHRRKQRLRRWLHGSASETAGHLPSEESSPHEAVEKREATARLYRVLDAMSEKYRTVLILFELERLSGEAISEVMCARVETVWVWLHRARAQFNERLERLNSEERGR